jgi:DNA invertase Pin-like site-specific DNA recombinase
MAKIIGYARVSTIEQDLSLQIDALKTAGCEQQFIFADTVSGAKVDRPGLVAGLKLLDKGDILLVWRLDRLGRSMVDLVNLIESLRCRGIGFRSLCDGAIDTTTASGELIFNVFSALAQFERRLIQERTKAGLSAARARGRKGGRHPVTAADPRVRMAKIMYHEKAMDIQDVCRTLKISRATFYRYIAIEE